MTGGGISMAYDLITIGGGLGGAALAHVMAQAEQKFW